MFVMPVSRAIDSDSGQRYTRQRNNPTFGLQLSQGAEVIIDYLRAELSKRPKKNHQQKVTSKMIAIIDELKDRINDNIKLDIVRVQDGNKEVLQLTLQKVEETFNNAPLQMVRFCEKSGYEIAQTLKDFFLDEQGKILNRLAMATRIQEYASKMTGNSGNAGVSHNIPLGKIVLAITPMPKTAAQ